MLIKFAAEVSYLCLRDHPIHALVGLLGTNYHKLVWKHNKMTSSLYQRSVTSEHSTFYEEYTIIIW